MKVAVAGEFGTRPDEGMRRTAQELARALEPLAQVHRFDLAAVGQAASWRGLRGFGPHAVLYVPGPSLRSLVLLRALKRAGRARLTATLTLNPESLGPAWAVRRFRPDFVFTHSTATASRFSTLGIPHRPLRIGVDAARFRPAGPQERAKAREELGLRPDGRILLHVGHLKEGRNLRSLTALTPQWRVVVLGSTATRADPALVADLQAAGVEVLRAYLEDPSVAYRAADAYVFPVVHAHNATEIPLSILEALASGLPVVSTPYGGVPALLAGCAAARVVEPQEFPSVAAELLAGDHAGAARQAGLAFGWDRTASEVVRAFEEAAA